MNTCKGEHNNGQGCYTFLINAFIMMLAWIIFIFLGDVMLLNIYIVKLH